MKSPQLVECPTGEVVGYRLEQQFRYSYESRVHDVRQRLMVVPRAVHGGQRRRSFSLAVDGGTAVSSMAPDDFGNDVVKVRLESVDSMVEFNSWSDIDIRETSGGPPVRSEALSDPRFLAPSGLTRPDRRLTQVGSDLARVASGETLAELICSWTHSEIEYGFGATTVRTTASEVASGRQGVCQDFAHVMIAVCRSANLPARYVSGHLIGEGGSHAWVEVLLADATGGKAVAFDPTHNRRTSSRYVTVAIGHDYADVAPTSGTFEGACSSMLTSAKRLIVRGEDPSLILD